MNTTPSTHRDGLHDTEADLATSLENLGHRATDLAVEGAHSVRDRALQARDTTAGWIQQQPLAAVLLAAASGAAVTLLAGWLMRASATRHRAG